MLEDAGEDPSAGSSSGLIARATFLKMVVMTTAEGNQLAIHAVPMRARFGRLLGP
jgi:hypothetical protein